MAYKTLGEASDTITIPAGQQINFLNFPNNTSIVLTFYINNAKDLPPNNSPGINIENANVAVSLTDGRFGNTNQFELDVYRFGKYLENYPINNIVLKNNFPLDIQIFYQYVIKEYSEYYSPLIQDLTQLQLTPNIQTDSLTPGTNFRFFGDLSTISFSGFSLADTFYILDQQTVGTSSTSTGHVIIPWTNFYSSTYSPPALGGTNDNTLYQFSVDSATQSLPSSATLTYADANFIEMDFFSPLSLSATSLSMALVYNTASNDFSVTGTQTLSAFATKFNAVPARGANVLVTS